jgi:polysaccharide biosynthesis transport protein
VRFTRRKKVVSAALERDLVLQKLSDAQSADLELQASIAEAGERMRSLDAKLREMPERKVSQIRNADNPQLQEKLKSKLLELELQRTELLTKFQPSYRLVQEIDKQIAQARSAIEAEDLKPLRDELTEDNPEYEWARSERMKAAVELQVMLKRGRVSQTQLAAYKRAAERLGEEVLEQSDLQEKLKAAQDKFLLYTSKREEARIGDALDQSGILNVALAQEPRVPALPSWPLWAATSLSFVAALLFGSGTAFTADYLDPSLRTPDEVAELIGAPVLIALPARTGSPEQEQS